MDTLRFARHPAPLLHGHQPYSHLATRMVCRAGGIWSRQPDEWELAWQQEEADKAAAAAQQARSAALGQQGQLLRQQQAWQHQQLLQAQKQRAALRERLTADAERAKQQQLRRIATIAKARARARGLASLGLDPDIMQMSEKFGKMSQIVDEVQQELEERYGLADTPTGLLQHQRQQQQGQEGGWPLAPQPPPAQLPQQRVASVPQQQLQPYVMQNVSEPQRLLQQQLQWLPAGGGAYQPVPPSRQPVLQGPYQLQEGPGQQPSSVQTPVPAQAQRHMQQRQPGWSPQPNQQQQQQQQQPPQQQQQQQQLPMQQRLLLQQQAQVQQRQQQWPAQPHAWQSGHTARQEGAWPPPRSSGPQPEHPGSSLQHELPLEPQRTYSSQHVGATPSNHMGRQRLQEPQPQQPQLSATFRHQQQ